MRIVLVRHGKPLLDLPKRINTQEIARWIADYNAAGIDSSEPPGSELCQLASNCAVSISSDLPRAVQSAQRLGHQPIQSALHREMALPYVSFPTPRLSPYIWLALFRGTWFLGFSRNGESYRQAQQRVTQAARQLIQLAEQHQTVLFVGHGILNGLLYRELRQQGWTGIRPSWRQYWAHCILEK